MTRMRSKSTMGFCDAGWTTPASRVQGKFSIQEAWLATASISCTLARVRGAFHQLWNFTAVPGWSAIHSIARAPAGALPPWPLTRRMRRKPWRAKLSSTSRTSAR